MKTKDLLTITSVAVGTAALTVAAFWAGPIGAGGDGDEPNKVPQPRLVSHGAELTLVAKDGRVFQAGDEAVFELRGVNRTNQAASVQVKVVMTAMELPNPMSRGLSMSVSLWEGQRTLTLNPGETNSLEFASGIKLPANRIITVRMHEVVPDGTTPNQSGPMIVDSRPVMARMPAFWNTGANSAMPSMMMFSTAPKATARGFAVAE